MVTGITPYSLEKKEEYIPCQCLGEVLSVCRYYDEEETTLTVYKYSSVSFNFFDRLKMAWKVFKGEGVATADVVLSKENFDKLRNFDLKKKTVKEGERELIENALLKFNGHRAKAAEYIGISERTFYRKIKKYNLYE